MFKDKETKKEYERLWYKTTGKEKRKAANKKWRIKQTKDFQEFKKTLQCNRCPENHPACLEFHHIDPSIKEIEVSRAAQIWSLKRLKTEIEKCEILCSNCHKKEHYKILLSGSIGTALLL